jgi:hypothetical protein
VLRRRGGAVAPTTARERAMSGHNRWSKIERYKEAQGAAKGKLFSDELLEQMA